MHVLHQNKFMHREATKGQSWQRFKKKDFIPKKNAIFSHIHTNQCEARWTVSFFKFVPDTLTWYTWVGGEPMALVLDNQVLCICTSCYSENFLEVSGTFLLFIFSPVQYPFIHVVLPSHLWNFYIIHTTHCIALNIATKNTLYQFCELLLNKIIHLC